MKQLGEKNSVHIKTMHYFTVSAVCLTHKAAVMAESQRQTKTDVGIKETHCFFKKI